MHKLQLEASVPAQVFGEEQKISLANLSPQAKALINLVAASPDLLPWFVSDPGLAWKWAEAQVGVVTASERRTLELLAEIMLPDRSSSVAIFTACGSSCDWHDSK